MDLMLVKRVKRIYSPPVELFHDAFIDFFQWENSLFFKVILLSIDYYSIHSYNIDIVEISSPTYVATESFKKKK